MALLYLLLLPLLFLLTYKLFFSNTTTKKPIPLNSPDLPGTYPLIGSLLSLRAHGKDHLNWTTTLLQSSPTSTVIARMPFGAGYHIFTANPANVEHMIKMKFSNYPKGNIVADILEEFIGRGIFSVDGQEWKLQRQIASHEFSTNSLKKFIETVVDKEINSRLLPILETAAVVGTGQVVDFQDILRRFGIDNICEIAFGYDPECLLPSLPESPFADGYDALIQLLAKRFGNPLWRVKRFLNTGSERELKQKVSLVRDFAQSIAREKIITHQAAVVDLNHTNLDILTRFIIAGHNDERFLTDIIMSFLLAGRDTTSAALTWFFWVISQHPRVEQKILDELKSIDNICPKSTTFNNSFEEAKREMIYTQAALFESMRLYPPISVMLRQSKEDDRWPDGTVVVAGTLVMCSIYAMGRMEKIWGNDWSEFKPERWLVERHDGEGSLKFVSKDMYSYPVFHAGPRICLGKEMAVLQMKRIVSEVLKRFKVVPVNENGFEPVYVQSLMVEMEGGFPVKFVKRD